MRKIKQHPTRFLFVTIVTLILAGLLKDAIFHGMSLGREIQLFLDFITLETLGTDSLMPIQKALDAHASEIGDGVYQTVFFTNHIKFQYPPTCLLPFLLLGKLGLDRSTVLSLMHGVSLISVLGIAFLVYRIGVTILSESSDLYSKDSKVIQISILAISFVGTLSFYPIMYGYKIGQIQVFLNLILCAAMLFWLKDRKVAAGTLLAIAALVKPQYGIIVVWSLFRGHTQFTKGFLFTALPITSLSLIIFGLTEHLDYFSVLSYIAQHGEVYWPNQSMNGLLNQLLSDVDPLIWQWDSYAPYHPLVHAGTLASSIFFIAMALIYKSRPQAPKPVHRQITESLLDFATCLLAITIASPVAWEHHYGIAWPIIIAMFALIATRLNEQKNRGYVVVIVMTCASYLLISNYLTSFSDSFSAPPLNIIQSYVFAGGLLLFGSLFKLRSNLSSD